MIRTFAAAALALTVALPAAAQQPQAAPAPGPQVGDDAPDFTARGATREGVRAEPIRLADYKGKTVVLAFFPAARTRGCTVQMESYRDQYATLFRGGKDVVVIGVSTDADTTLAGWAKEANFPMLFASDVDQKVGALYGATRPNAKSLARHLYVIAPDGRIAYKVTPFNAMAQDAYTELGKAVEAAAGAK
jgi:peroxiredoxin Q/BCP